MGAHVVREALNEGHSVTAVSRAPGSLELEHPRLERAAVDVRDAARLRAVLPGHEAVLCTLGYRRHGETPDVLSVGMRHLIAEMPEVGLHRLVALSSAGILQWDADRLRCERPGYPASFLPGASMHRQAWQALEASPLDWTLVCPPELIEGPREQPLLVQPDFLPQAPKHVSMPALARWMVETAVHGAWIRKRVGVIDAPPAD